MPKMKGPLAFAMLLAGTACLAQTAPVPLPVAPAPVPIVAGAVGAPMLRTGLAIPMRTLVELTTLKKTLAVGQRVPLEVAEPVMLNGQTVIPAGTPGMGEITSVRNKGMWGKSGAFAGRVVFIRVNDREIRMSGAFDDKGSAGGGAAVAASALVFLPAGFFMTGTSAKMPIGAPVKAFLAEDVPVVLASAPASPAPLQAVMPNAPVAAVPLAVAATAPVSQVVLKK